MFAHQEMVLFCCHQGFPAVKTRGDKCPHKELGSIFREVGFDFTYVVEDKSACSKSLKMPFADFVGTLTEHSSLCWCMLNLYFFYSVSPSLTLLIWKHQLLFFVVQKNYVIIQKEELKEQKKQLFHYKFFSKKICQGCSTVVKRLLDSSSVVH